MQPEAPHVLPLQADKAKVLRVLTNLVNNAVKYSPSGGKVRVKIAKQGSEAVVSVSDHGIGLTAEQLSKLFGLFSRVVDKDVRIPGASACSLQSAS